MLPYYRAIASLLSSHFSCGEEKILSLLERPPNSQHGDIALPCFFFAKELRTSPPKIAKDLEATLSLPEGFSSMSAQGPYLNFSLSSSSVWGFAKEVLTQQEGFGKSNFGQGKKVVIEFSSPNLAKPLHIGHFRNTILGQSLSNIYKATGHEVIKINHLGDWGSQFGKIAYSFLHWGKESELAANPIAYLTTLYVRFHEESKKNPDLDKKAQAIFKKIEERDPEIMALWQRFVDISLKDLKKIYRRLHVDFDHYWGESFYVDKIDSLLEELKAKKLLVKSEGAQVVLLEDLDAPPCLIITSEGTTLYATRDLAAAIYRKEKLQFDSALYVVGSEQNLHFKQIFAVLDRMNHAWSKNLHHVSYGLYRFKDGKLSTRAGKIVLLQDVIDQAVQKVRALMQEKNPDLENQEEIAEMVGLGALIYNDLSTDRNKDVEFDWKRILDLEGDTGPYLQYSYARASSILREAKKQGYTLGKTPSKSCPHTLISCPEAMTLLKSFGEMERTLLGAVRLQKPSIVAHYALDVAKNFHSFYNSVKVLDPNIKRTEVEDRISVVEASCLVMKSTFHLLCMGAPSKM